MKKILAIVAMMAGVCVCRPGPAAAQQAEFFQEPDTTTIVSQAKIDLNTASIDQIAALPGMAPALAGRIHQYRFEHGAFTSIYQLMAVPGLTATDLKRLKAQVKIVPPPAATEINKFIADLQDRLASEENPGLGALNEIEDYLLHPMDINGATVDQLLLLQNVSLVDAAAVTRHIGTQGAIKDWRTLQRNVKNLSHFGFTSMRNYVSVDQKSDQLYVDGNYRLRLERSDRIDDGGENDFRMQLSSLQSALNNYVPGSAPYDTMTTAKILGSAGWTAPEIARLKAQVTAERDQLTNPSNYGSMSQRLICNLGNHYRVGFASQKDAYENKATNKGYIGMYNVGPLDKLFIGNYRLTVAQGLVMDNTDETMIRRTQRGAGLFGDVTPSYEYAFRGLAAQASLWRLTPIVFYSDNLRDGVLNRDGSVNSYFTVAPRYSWYRDAFREQTAGANIGWDLSGFSGLPYGTKLGVTGFQSHYDKPIQPLAAELDLPLDKNELNDPNYIRQWSGQTRRVWGADFRTVYENLSLESEVGKLSGGGWASLWQARLQYETVYFIVQHRSYDVDYDNPFNRGFSEQAKFDNTLLDKDYRLLDPTYTQMTNTPQPKAERGTYLETRWQITRQLTLTRGYLDFWQNAGWGLNNFRCQAELEYRPVFPVHIRLKQKWQVKNLPKSADPTQSRTYETTLRTYCTLSARDFFNVEFRYGEVHLTPSQTYGSNMLMSGGYLATNWEHNFSPTWDCKAGLASWRSDAMSQWIFEDTGIDFLGGDGMKYYVTLS
ncbi:MAG TPA: helix-hairpin-helix domain-containing protein, partial [Candidatus Edwardsbacteria bacterium]|nr:helix-hairpin-helix domain-containing protein [Candidatus Edwardsbacteria bacterium]